MNTNFGERTTNRSSHGAAPWRRRIAVAHGALVFLGACGSTPPPPWTDEAAYWITARRTSDPIHAWDMGVSLERHGDRALAVVPIRLAPDASLDPATVRRRAIAWEREAERAWSGQVALQVSGMPPLTLDLDVRLDPPTGPATTVVVLPGAGPADLGGWRVDNPDGIAAHEIGHLLGAWDEYTHGAQDPTQPVIDRTHLMGRESPGAVPHPRSYEPLAAELAQRLGAPVAVVPLRPEAP